jgi:hypothetical protein
MALLIASDSPLPQATEWERNRKSVHRRDDLYAGEQSSLLARIAATESISLCERMKKLTAFVELESAIEAIKKDRMSR